MTQHGRQAPFRHVSPGTPARVSIEDQTLLDPYTAPRATVEVLKERPLARILLQVRVVLHTQNKANERCRYDQSTRAHHNQRPCVGRRPCFLCSLHSWTVWSEHRKHNTLMIYLGVWSWRNRTLPSMCRTSSCKPRRARFWRDPVKPSPGMDYSRTRKKELSTKHNLQGSTFNVLQRKYPAAPFKPSHQM